eukprot:CAMPEP_0115477014 /NCGR_PEP_ID=MMETSP0271-20121206/55449_1 /TAXON_ID=71861 /ORGANISM="Scrippsiella trochoidea, Strain CCMP3099" /LENGTH=64 /DNA_ID=CAMNT_0002904475 /DNA_START=150 /DNA_END=344 /DNA_ORIENTATION=+
MPCGYMPQSRKSTAAKMERARACARITGQAVVTTAALPNDGSMAMAAVNPVGTKGSRTHRKDPQ